MCSYPLNVVRKKQSQVDALCLIIDHPEYAGIAALSVIISHSVLTRFSVLAVVCPRIV